MTEETLAYEPKIAKRMLIVAGIGLLALVVIFMLGTGHAKADRVGPGPVSGTWDTTGSPYWVEGSITIPAGQTLVIKPGVQVRFNGSYSITVSGTLSAQGTDTEPIMFESNNSMPAPGDWNGINLFPGSSASEISHCNIFHADTGIDIGLSSPTVEDNEISENNIGILVLYDSAPIISRNRITHNDINVILDSCYGTVLDNNVISNGGMENVLITSYDDLCSVTLRNNQIIGSGNGIEIYSESYEITVLLENNNISGSYYDGTYAHGGYGIDLLIYNCQFMNNLNTGLYSEVNANMNIFITGTEFSGNINQGVYVDGYGNSDCFTMLNSQVGSGPVNGPGVTLNGVETVLASNCQFLENYYCGLSIDGSNIATVTGCFFNSNNRGDDGNGQLEVYDTQSFISNSVFLNSIYSAIYIDGTEPTIIENNTIAVSDYYGIYAYSGRSPGMIRIWNTHITGCYDFAVYMQNYNIVMGGCTIIGNSAGVLFTSEYAIISDCTISDNVPISGSPPKRPTEGGIIGYLSGGGNPTKQPMTGTLTVTGCTIERNQGDGISVDCNLDMYATLENNIIANNYGNGVNLYANRDIYSTFIGNTITGSEYSGVNLYADGRVEQAYIDGNIITYNVQNPMGMGFGITIYSYNWYGNVEIWNSDVSYNNGPASINVPGHNFLMVDTTIMHNDGGIYFESEYATISGCTISYNGPVITKQGGSPVLCGNILGSGPKQPATGTVVIEDSVFENNDGTAIDIYASGEMFLTFNGNTLTDNLGTGACFNAQWVMYATVLDNTITGSEGDGLELIGTQAVNAYMDNNIISYNEYAGIYINSDGWMETVEIRNTETANNGGYGVYVDYCDLVMVDCTVFHNNGGVWFTSDYVSIDGCTISYNLAPPVPKNGVGGGGLYGTVKQIDKQPSAGTATIKNSTFEGNEARGIYINSPGDMHLTMENNIIKDNLGDGAHFYASGTLYATITRNVISGSGNSGLYIDCNTYMDAFLENNEITSNDGDGVYAYSDSGPGNIEIWNSDISYNGNYAIYLDWLNLAMYDTIVTHNNYGIDFDSEFVIIDGCTITDNTQITTKDRPNGNAAVYGHINGYNPDKQPTAGTVSITDTSIERNDGSGVDIQCNGGNMYVNMEGNTITDNEEYGISLDNDYQTLYLTMIDTTIARSGWTGLYLYSNNPLDAYLEGNTITQNGQDTSNPWYGIYAYSAYSWGILEIQDSEISWNTNYGVRAAFTNLVMDGCTVTNNNGGVFFESSYAAFSRCTISNNSAPINKMIGAGGVGGMLYSGGKQPTAGTITIEDNEFDSNDGSAIGILSDGPMYATIKYNTIANNMGYGIMLNAQSSTIYATFVGNTIAGSEFHGLYLNSNNGDIYLTLENNDILNSGGYSSYFYASYNMYATITDSTFTGSNGEGMHLSANYELEAYLNNNVITYNEDEAIHAQGMYGLIQIWNCDLSFNEELMEIEYVNLEMYDSTVTHNHDSIYFNCDYVIFDGCTMSYNTGGNTKSPYGAVLNGRFGDLPNKQPNAGTAIIKDCTFENNDMTAIEIYSFNYDMYLTLENNVIRDNLDYGAYFHSNNNMYATITGNTITGSVNEGIHLWASGELNAYLDNNVITYCGDEAIDVYGYYGLIQIWNSDFSYNEELMEIQNVNLEMYDSTVTHNHDSIYFDCDYAIFSGCTISYNEVVNTKQGGPAVLSGILGYSPTKQQSAGTLIIEDCTFEKNDGTAIDIAAWMDMYLAFQRNTITDSEGGGAYFTASQYMGAVITDNIMSDLSGFGFWVNADSISVFIEDTTMERIDGAGVRIQGNSLDIYMQSCNVHTLPSSSIPAVYIVPGGTYLTAQLYDLEIVSGDDGIYFEGPATNLLVIDGCDVTSEEMGIRWQAAGDETTVRITDNNVHDCLDNGIYGNISPGTRGGNIEITNNLVTNCRGTGIHLHGDWFDYNAISHNQVINCSGGIYTYRANGTISYNTIQSSGFGVYIQEAYAWAFGNTIFQCREGINIIGLNPLIEHNTVTDASVVGIWINFATPTLRYNDISSPSTVLHGMDSTITLQQCTLSGLTSFELEMSTVNLYDCTFNQDTSASLLDSTSQIHAWWSIIVKVVDLNGIPVSGIPVIAHNALGTELFNDSTRGGGLTDDFYARSYFQNTTGKHYDDNTHVAAVTQPGGAVKNYYFYVYTTQTITLMLNRAPTVFSVPALTAYEDQPFSYKIFGADPDGDAVAFSDDCSLFTINPVTGDIIFTPTNAQVGVYTVHVNVTDAFGGLTMVQFTLTVLNTNDVPAIPVIPNQIASEDLQFTYLVTATDVDAGDVLAYSLTTAPAGMTIDATSGLITWTPTNSDAGKNHTVVVTVTDMSGATASRQFIISVNNTNDAPTLTAIPDQTATEDMPFYLFAMASDVDAGTTLTFSDDSDLFVINPTTGRIMFTPTNDQVGTYTITITVSDGTATASTTFVLTIKNLNDAPTLDAVADGTTAALVQFTRVVTASDIDIGDTLTFSLVSAPEGMSIDPVSGVITWTPRLDQVGTHIIYVVVQDAAGAKYVRPFTVTATQPNRPCTLEPMVSLEQGYYTEDFKFAVKYTDLDGDAPAIIVVVIDGEAFTMTRSTESGSFSDGVIYELATSLDLGQHVYFFQADDGQGHTATTNAQIVDIVERPAKSDGLIPYLFLIIVIIALILWVIKWLFFDRRKAPRQGP